MKKFTLIVFAALLSLASKAQEVNNVDNTQKVYLSLGTGINSSTGLLGVGFEAPIGSHFGAKISAGFGGWGLKTAVQGKYYKMFPSSWAFGLGYSTASGGNGVEYEVELNDGTRSKKAIDLSRAHMLDLVVNKSWGKHVRFTLDLGYAIKVAGGDFKSQDSSVELSSTSESMFKLLSPGGIIVGVGVAFGL